MSIKKTITISFFLFLNFSGIFSQSNGGFENWTSFGSYQDPDNWQTLNFLSQFVNPISAFKVSGPDKHSGNYALKITSVYLPNKIINQLPDTMGLVFNGKIGIAPPSYQPGSIYTSRPTKLSFYSKYVPVGMDTALAGATLYRHLPTGRDTIANGQIDVYASGVYTYYEVTLNYRSAASPDSANIYFQASNKPLAKRVGSSLYLDDVLFIGGVGINEYKNYGAQVKLFPNPVNNLLTINAQLEEAEKVEVSNVFGFVLDNYHFNNYNAFIKTELYPDGCYLYRILNSKNEILTSGKFIVDK